MKYNCLSVLYDIAPSQKHTVLMVVYFEQFPNPSHIQALFASERNPHVYVILSHTAVTVLYMHISRLTIVSREAKKKQAVSDE